MRLLDLLTDPVRLPLVLAAIAALVRVVYALVSRLVRPYPRLRAIVEAVAALAPDLLRAVLQVWAAVTGRPAPRLDVVPGPDLAGALAIEERAHASARAAMGELLAQLNDAHRERAALAARIAELTAAPDGGRPTMAPDGPTPR